MLHTFRVVVAIVGTTIVVLGAAVPAGLIFFVALLFNVVIAYPALWRVSSSTNVYVAVRVGIVGALALIPPTFVYINYGHWNEPGTQWAHIPLWTGTVLLGTNIFGIYVRHMTSRLGTFVGGPALTVVCALAFFWHLSISAARADLFMYRLLAVFVGLYGLLGTLLAGERFLRRM